MASLPERISTAFEMMSRRERVMVFGLIGAVGALVFLLTVYLVYDGLEERRTKNKEMSDVIKDLDRYRSRLMAGKSEDARVSIKLNRQPPALQGHLDKLAKRFEVEVKDFSPSKPKALGKRKKVLRKSTVVSIYGVELAKLSKFLNGIEQGNFLIMTTRLRVKPRHSEHAKLDVTKLEVATYERNVTATGKKGKKGERRGRKGKKPGRKGKTK